MNYGYNKESFRNFFEEEYTWLNGFMRNVKRFAGKTALFCPETGTSLTYSELNCVTNKLANAFASDNTHYGDVVMFQLYNCVEFVYCYVAAQKIGAIACPINFRLSAGETAMTIDDSKPRVFVYDSAIKDVAVKALEMAQHKPDVVLCVDTLNGSQEFNAYLNKGEDKNPVPEKPFNIYDEVTRLYTSGTTGKPKGVPLNSINEVLTSHDVLMNFPLNCNDTTMNTTPWFHRGGLHSGGPTPTLYVGGKVVVMRKFNAEICLKYVQKYKITFLIGVPAVLSMLNAQQEQDNADLSSLKGIITMGSPLEKEACKRFMQTLTPNIFNGYGTTETFWNTFLSPSDLPQMAGSAGKACTDDEVHVVKVYEDGRRTEPDDLAAQDGSEVGEIIIKSPAKTTCCYFNNEAETQAKYYKGYIYTNDLGTWDENQYVSVVGRKDDMIISAGENIYPVQVEEVLNRHPKVKDCIVTAVPDKARGEVVTAYVIAEDDTLTAQELEKYCKASPMMSGYKRPRYYKFVDSIPLNATGKKQHFVIKQIAAKDAENGELIKV